MPGRALGDPPKPKHPGYCRNRILRMMTPSSRLRGGAFRYKKRTCSGEQVLSFFVLFQGTGYGLPGTRGGLAEIGGAFTHLGAGLRCALAQCLAGAFAVVSSCVVVSLTAVSGSVVGFSSCLAQPSSTVASTVTASAKIINRFFIVLPSFRFYSARRRRFMRFIWLGCHDRCTAAEECPLPHRWQRSGTPVRPLRCLPNA